MVTKAWLSIELWDERVGMVSLTVLSETDLPDGLTTSLPFEALRTSRECRAFVIYKNKMTWHLHA